MSISNGSTVSVSPSTTVSEYLIAEEIASRLHVTTATVYEWARRRVNPLPSFRVSHKHILFRWADVSAWVQSGGLLRPRKAA